MKLIHLPLLISLLLLQGLATAAEPDETALKHCEDPRPQFCTMIYAPVCGVDDGGNKKTYPSDCTACSNEKVVGFEQGECPQVVNSTDDE